MATACGVVRMLNTRLGGSTLDSLDIEDRWAFIRVAYIHNASYLGGVIGLVLALLLVRPDR